MGDGERRASGSGRLIEVTGVGDGRRRPPTIGVGDGRRWVGALETGAADGRRTAGAWEAALGPRLGAAPPPVRRKPATAAPTSCLGSAPVVHQSIAFSSPLRS